MRPLSHCVKFNYRLNSRPMGKDRNMTSEKRIKLAKFSQAVLAGNTQKKAALIAGVKDSPSIDVTASKMIREPQVIRAIDAALNRAGASLDKSARVIAEAHGANIVKVFNDNGEMTYSKPLADHVTRMKAA